MCLKIENYYLKIFMKIRVGEKCCLEMHEMREKCCIKIREILFKN